MSLTRLAVDRPITTLMSCASVVLLGAVALRGLAVDLMPDVTYPTVSVTTLYQGAAPVEVETLVTRPLEQALSAVSGLERLASYSNEGSSTILTRFRWGADLDASIAEMRQSIQRIRLELPEDIEEPYFRKYDVSDDPMMYIGVASSLEPVRLTQLTEQHIAPRLERLPGVARVRLRGGARREIQVDVARDKLEAMNMGVNEVVAALRRENVSQRAGDFGQGHVNLLVRSQGDFQSLDQIADTVLREHEGAIVRVRDVAEIVDGEERRTELTRMNGESGMMIYIHQQAGANTIDVSDAVHRAIDELNRQLTDARLSVRVDKARFIRQAIGNVRQAGVYGMGLAMLVLIVFLRSFRSSAAIGIAMPLSVLATFVLIYFNGYTLNMVSFGGLALGMGLLVDNSIVVLESIFRKREDGLAVRDAAIEGTQEVASAIVASSVTTLIVFVPLLFISGMTGVLLHQLAAVVSFSLLCSLLGSLTLTPVLATYWIFRNDGQARPRWWSPGGIASAFHAINHRILSAIERVYAGTLRFALRLATPSGLSILLAFSSTLGLAPRIGTEFLPKTDEADLMVRAEMAPGIQLETLDRQARRLERAIDDSVTEATSVGSFVGDSADDADDWNRCFCYVTLPPRDKRDRSIDDIRKAVADRIGQVPGMTLRVEPRQSSVFGRSFRFGRGDLEIEIRGYDTDIARELSGRVEEVMKATAGLVNIKSEIGEIRPELMASINRTKAGLQGVSVSEIAQALETTVRGTRATVFREAGDEFNVLVRLRESDRDERNDIDRVGVTTPGGQVVPLRSFVEFRHSDSLLTIQRLDQQRLVAVSAAVEDRDLGSVVAELQHRLSDIRMPEGFAVRIAGDWEEQQESFMALTQGAVLAIILMYMVMASQFESLLDPLMILATIPLGAIGVILVLLLTGTTLNVQSFIGVIMLAGIVVNNAIVLVDYIRRLRQSNPELSPDELIVRAATRRFRPILMTTLTTVLAMLPMALGWGEGGELQAPMARVVIGGLVSGTLITLYAIPLLARTRRQRAVTAG